jgi:4-methyl-5(b-hydroxyethyl)-thiazole monophosphate biosynthesis
VITGSHRISVSTDLLLEDVSLQPSDMLVLPGGLGGVMSMKASPSATCLIQNAHHTGCWLAAICAAPTVLGQLGILNGRKAVSYPGMED